MINLIHFSFICFNSETLQQCESSSSEKGTFKLSLLASRKRKSECMAGMLGKKTYLVKMHILLVNNQNFYNFPERWVAFELNKTVPFLFFF